MSLQTPQALNNNKVNRQIRHSLTSKPSNRRLAANNATSKHGAIQSNKLSVAKLPTTKIVAQQLKQVNRPMKAIDENSQTSAHSSAGKQTITKQPHLSKDIFRRRANKIASTFAPIQVAPSNKSSSVIHLPTENAAEFQIETNSLHFDSITNVNNSNNNFNNDNEQINDKCPKHQTNAQNQQTLLLQQISSQSSKALRSANLQQLVNVTNTHSTKLPSNPSSSSSCPSTTTINCNSQQNLLQPTKHSTHHKNNKSSLKMHSNFVRRKANLCRVKTLIISLIAIDLLITVFVHLFATSNQPIIFQISSTFKMRFSTLNLLLSLIWYIVLIGAIMFDVLSVLIIGCCVDVLSFVCLLAMSIVHFTKRIDYNNANLASLLTLLFSISVLHVYLLVMASLMIYLTRAVRRRQQ